MLDALKGRAPVGVIGPRDATPDQYALAEKLGRALGKAGQVVLCGGGVGVMEAIAKGVRDSGGPGLTIGLLPGGEPAAANPYIDIPLATGIGVARNAIIAQSARLLIAIGGGHGTTSEMAFGLQFGKTVLGLGGAPELSGVTYIAGITPDAEIEEVMELVEGV